MERVIKFRVINNGKPVAIEYLSESGWEHVLLNTMAKHDGVFEDKLWGHKAALKREQFIGIYDSTKWNELSGDELDSWVNGGNKPSEWKGRPIYEGDVIKETSRGSHNTSPYTVVASGGGFMGISEEGDDFGPFTMNLFQRPTTSKLSIVPSKSPAV